MMSRFTFTCECGETQEFPDEDGILDFYGDETNKTCCRHTARNLIHYAMIL